MHEAGTRQLKHLFGCVQECVSLRRWRGGTLMCDPPGHPDTCILCGLPASQQLSFCGPTLIPVLRLAVDNMRLGVSTSSGRASSTRPTPLRTMSARPSCSNLAWSRRCARTSLAAQERPCMCWWGHPSSHLQVTLQHMTRQYLVACSLALKFSSSQALTILSAP